MTKTIDMGHHAMIMTYWDDAAAMMPQPSGFFEGYLPVAIVAIPAGFVAARDWQTRFLGRSIGEHLPGGTETALWIREHGEQGGQALLPSGAAVMSYEQADGGRMFWVGCKES